MPHVLLLATRNAGKVRELRELFADLEGLSLRTLDEVEPMPDVIEDGATFEDNAIKKAWEPAFATGFMTLSDDSGLEVDALGGRPGVRSARYAGEGSSDEANNQKLIEELAGIPAPQRTARYRVVLALADPKGQLGKRVHFETGVCDGRIRELPRGANGFGYDPYFEPIGFDRTMAELAAEEKNKISHRAVASRAMHKFLREYLG